MNPPSPSSRRGPLLVLSLAFIALLVLPVVIATVGVDEERDAAVASATTTEAPTTADPSTTAAPAATTTEPAPTTTAPTEPETTTTTVDLASVYSYAAALDRAKATTTTTAPPAPVVEAPAEPVYEAPAPEPTPEPEPVYEAPAPAPAAGGSAFANLSASDIDFLACIRQRESGGDYTAVNPSSGAGGAYQFLRDTWNNTAAHAGRSDLIGTAPQWASPYDQDVIAADLITWYGRSPWSYSCY